eukprot:Skav227731  [mRNA]  locus=scaffold5201:17760:18389:- [translate_table: standard]
MVYFTQVLPEIQGFLMRLCITGILGFLFLWWSYHYVQLLRVEPGSPPTFDEALAEAAAAGMAPPERCKRCACAKFAGTHHCSRCNRCVLKMDHHCSLTNSCIGLRNRHHFHGILLVQLFGLLFVLVVHGWQLLEAARNLMNSQQLHWRRLPQHLVNTWFLALGLFVDIFALSLWHLYLTLTKQSTIDVWGRIFWDSDGSAESDLPKKSS